MLRGCLSACMLLIAASPMVAADTANADCWAYAVEIYDDTGTLQDSYYGSYCWTSNPAVFAFLLTPGSEAQYWAMAGAHEAGAPGIEHYQNTEPLPDGGWFVIDGYEAYQGI